MTKPKFQLECLEGRLTPTVSFFLVPPEVPSGAYSIGSYDSEQPDATQPTVAILGLADGETPVALTESADGTSSFLLAASVSGFEATLYTIDPSSAHAAVIGSSASVSLVLADGSAVAFPAHQNYYGAGLDESGQLLLIDVVNESFVTRFRIDPTTGLAIDGDSEIDGTQPDHVIVPVICELPPAEPVDQPEVVVDPVDPPSPQPVDQNYNYIPVQIWFDTIINGIDSSETLVSYTTNGESAYALAVNGDANTATLYQISTLDDVSTATAVGNIGSIALSFADGNSVEFSIYSGQYITEVDADGNLIVCEHNAGLLTTFRVDLTTGLAIDADVEADGTQPDSSLTVVQDFTPPPEWCT
ncbi:MAG: hypothetical protein EBS30_09050, partial [Planctomycetes bacterium]|nr:hypothetical protein [Planctomycetota bacterium]